MSAGAARRRIDIGDRAAWWPPRLIAGVLLAVLFAIASVFAQTQGKLSKVPVIGKMTGGSTQAFSGKFHSIDFKRHLLKVNTVTGDHTELFQINKGVSVRTAEGEKMKAKNLKPGTDVLVYFEVKEERPTVKEIVILTAPPAEEKKAPPPS